MRLYAIVLFYIFPFLLAHLALAAPDKQKSFRICYFSLNTDKEYRTAKKFADRLNALAKYNIEVIEYMPDHADPQEAFKKMVDETLKKARSATD